MKEFRQKCIASFNRLQDSALYYVANSSNFSWVVGFAMVAASLWLRSSMYIGTDPAFYYLAAARVLRGERYYYDFFETNFPLNFYIYTIPVIFHKITGVAAGVSLVGFITIVALVSIYCSSLILKKSSIYKDKTLYHLLIIGLFLGHFFPMGTFPINEIGTKTLLFLAFSTPYLFSFFLEAENKKLPLGVNILIGIFAGLAVCLKPHYVFFPIGMELYILLKHRSFRYTFRPMNYAILAVNILHLAWLIIFLPEFLFKALPTIMVSYHGTADNFFYTFFIIIIGAQVALILLLLIVYKKIPQCEYRKILLFASIATGIILGAESHFTRDQMSILYFFDGLLVIKIVYDLLRNTPKFNFYQKTALSLSLIWLANAVIVNSFPDPWTLDYFNRIQKIRSEIPDGKHSLMLTGLLYSALFLDNDDIYYNKITSLGFLLGAKNTQERHKDSPDSSIYKMAADAEKYIRTSEIEEINKYKPKLLFIQNNNTPSDVLPEGYLEYFLQYEDFREAFSHYEFYDRIQTIDPDRRGSMQFDASIYIRK